MTPCLPQLSAASPGPRHAEVLYHANRLSTYKKQEGIGCLQTNSLLHFICGQGPKDLWPKPRGFPQEIRDALSRFACPCAESLCMPLPHQTSFLFSSLQLGTNVHISRVGNCLHLHVVLSRHLDEKLLTQLPQLLVRIFSVPDL